MKKTINLIVAISFLVSLLSTHAWGYRSFEDLGNANLSNSDSSLLIAEDAAGKCVFFGKAKDNVGRFCNKPTGGLNESTATGSIRTANAIESNTLKGVNCTSRGRSNAGATGNYGAFCIAADIRVAKAPAANFSVANSLPVKSLQYLQITFRDGSKLVGTRPVPPKAVATGSTCISVGGSKAAVTGQVGDFCIATDLIPAGTSPTHFAKANSLPVASLQILQATFSNTDPNKSNQSSSAGARCTSGGGSIATNKDAGGFCLASDLRTSSVDLDDFTIANKLPATGLQFLQVTFSDRYSADSTGHLLVSPNGAQCFSGKGSSARSGGGGEFCLASKLSTLATGFVNFTIANDLPVAGLQFLQAMFDGNKATAPSSSTTICKSAKGSMSSFGNAHGFCLAADRLISGTSVANLSLANNLPATGVQFIQVPFKGNNQTSGPRQPVDAGAGTGVTMSDIANFATHGLPDFARIAGSKQSYFKLSGQENGIILHSVPALPPANDPVFWISR